MNIVNANDQSRWIPMSGGLVLVIMAALLIGGVVLVVLSVKSFKAQKKIAAAILAVAGLVLVGIIKRHSGRRLCRL